jgi:porin
MKALTIGLAASALLAAPLQAANETADASDQPADAPAQPVPAATEPEAPDVAGAPVDEPVSLAKALGIAGVSPRLDLTAFVQTKVSGDGDESTRFTGRGDLFVDISSKGIGLWDGTILRTHTELRYSDTNAGAVGGALWPQNTAAVLPLTGEGIEVTSIYFVQSLGKKTNLIVGKVNALDLLASDPFFGGWGTKRFQNIAFVAPPSGVVPPTIMGAVLAHQAGDVGITVMMFDPEDRSGDYWVDGLFSTGVNASLGATWKGQLGGRDTSIGITATGSTSRGVDFEDILLPPGLEGGTKKGSYNIAIQFGHDLAGSVKGPSHLGIYAKAAIADGNPNIIQSSIVGGLAGHGLFAGRSRDRFGIGGYLYNFSDVLQDAADPLVEFDDEAGVEAWYALAIGGNVDLTFSAQVIDPARGSFDIATILGARLGLHF